MGEHEKAEKLAENAWKNLGRVFFDLICHARVTFSISDLGNGKYESMLSVSGASRQTERKIVEMFFGDRNVDKMEGLFCTSYASIYDAPKEIKEA